MKIKLILSLLILALIAVPLFAAACEEEVTPPGEEEEEEGLPPAEEEEEEANWWDEFGEPQYSGTITIPVIAPGAVTFDPWTGMGALDPMQYETLFWGNWALDRNIWSFQSDFTPEEYCKGMLAETWEWTDPLTLTIHLRQGILWQDMPPVNGREFVADDVAEHYHRLMGTDGYTEPNPAFAGDFAIIEKVTATDKYKVVFQFKQPTAAGIFTLMELGWKNCIEAPESVALEGGTITNWQNSVGTGPWIITDYVDGSSFTFSKNPDYWGYDERHPQNQLPYADTLKLLFISEESTRLAALRSGQIDFVGAQGSVGAVSWYQAQSLAESDPELQQSKQPQSGYALLMRVDNAPFTDIRVRKALQMSINRPEIAQNYYGGSVNGIPCGMVTPLYEGWCYPYDEWPQELKDEYSYNPTLAMQLLEEAATDGVFEPNDLGGFDTNVVTGAQKDLQLLQIIQSYFLDIGVDMDIETLEGVNEFAYCMQGLNDQLYYDSQAGIAWPPSIIINSRFSTGFMNFTHCNDPVYDEAVNRFNSATDMDGVKQALHDADKRAIEQHWSVYIFPVSIYSIYQPYLKGYSGELFVYGRGALWARLWIDQDLKESLGR